MAPPAARIVAALTVAYSSALVVAPKVLAKPCGLTGPTGAVPPSVAELTRSIGTRDVALAAAWGLTPVGRSFAVLTAARVVSDSADAIWLGRVAPRSQRVKIVGVALGWAALEAWTGLRALRQASS